MAVELRPGVLGALMVRINAQSEERAAIALGKVAGVIEARAKHNIGSSGTHRYGTKSPASPGGPPALISGTLRRSVTHSVPARTADGWECKVGTATGLYPPYGSRRTPSSRYGFYLETGLRNGTRFPWLLPAFRDQIGAVEGAFMAGFRGPWPHI